MIKKYLKIFHPAILFTLIGIILYYFFRTRFILINLIIIGIILSFGLMQHNYVKIENRRKVRLLSLWLFFVYFFIGYGFGLIYIFSGILLPENLQIEGFLFWVLAGQFSATVLHFLIAKIFGPLFFGRLWCGWVCWTAAVQDLLPWKKSPGRIHYKFEYLRYVSFSFSIAIVLVSIFFLNHSLIDNFGLVRLNSSSNIQNSIFQIPDFWWFIVGNSVYFFIGILLAWLLKDNRAFCKYVCPIAPMLKFPSHASLAKIEADPEICDLCGVCEKSCPMDIRLTEYFKNDNRVLSSECIMCFECINHCSKNALSLSWDIDYSVVEKLNRK